MFVIITDVIFVKHLEWCYRIHGSIRNYYGKYPLWTLDATDEEVIEAAKQLMQTALSEHFRAVTTWNLMKMQVMCLRDRNSSLLSQELFGRQQGNDS